VKKRVCFFVRTNDRTILERVEFYRQDLEALGQLDIDLQIATTWGELRQPADLYYIWWWNWAFLPLLAARWFRKPSLITGVLDLQNPQKGFGWYTRPLWERSLMRSAARGTTLNVFVSQMERGGCDREFGLTNSTYVPLGVDTARYTPRPESPAPASEPPFILAVAWLHSDNAYRKGIHAIVRATPALLRAQPDLRVVIAGKHGSGVPELQALARELGVEQAIEFPGTITAEHKIDLMQRCAVYLQPSLFEGFGLAILEAMSCGAAVVASPNGSIPEVVGDAGLFVDRENPDEIAAAVIGLLQSPARRAALGRKARQRAESEFPLARRQRGIVEIVERLLSGAPASAATLAVRPGR
jgi:glycosyltransferase involved in cell wall biosynthesis